MDENHPLKEFRERHDPPMSQDQLAKLIGVDRVSVTRWECGARLPAPSHLAKIKEVTGIKPQALRPDLAEIMDEAAE